MRYCCNHTDSENKDSIFYCILNAIKTKPIKNGRLGYISKGLILQIISHVDTQYV